MSLDGDCSNHRGISLIQIASKLLDSVILRRLYNVRAGQASKEQARFRTGRKCVDQIVTLRQVLEHHSTFQRTTIIVIYIRADFDFVNKFAL